MKSSLLAQVLRSIGVLTMTGCVLFPSGKLAAQENRSVHRNVLAPTPPMGWNSWDSFGLRINEQQFRDNAEVLSTKLRSFGYAYAVIDEGWYMLNPEDRPKPERLKYELDENGRFIPVPARFPSALHNGTNAGFEELGAWVHSRGLKFGIHIIRGIPRESVSRNLPIEGSKFKTQDAADQNDPCPWDPTSWGVKDNEAGQAWYDSLLRQYAAWGVDFVKVDCIADHPYKPTEIRQIASAIQHSGRDIVLSLSPGPTAVERHAEVADLAQMWRISDDIWDVWDKGNQAWPMGIKNQFDNAARWAQYSRPGNWPDADMLPVGELRPFPDVAAPRHTRLSPTEQKTQLSLWAMARSPLIIGANLTLLDDETLRMLTNSEILRIDQTSLASRQVVRDGDLVIWTADLPGNDFAIAAFNLGEKPITVDRPTATLGLAQSQHKARNAWTGERLSVGSRFTATIEPHASTVLVLDAE